MGIMPKEPQTPQTNPSPSPSPEQPKKGPDRRTFLKIAGAAAGAATVATGVLLKDRILGLLVPQSRVREVVDRLRTLRIPGAENVHVVIDDPDATHCLIHILQIHRDSTSHEEDQADAIEAQVEIERIIAFLMEDPVIRLRAVHAENLFQGETVESRIQAQLPLQDSARERITLNLMEQELRDIEDQLRRPAGSMSVDARRELQRQRDARLRSIGEMRARISNPRAQEELVERTRRGILRHNAVFRLHTERGLQVIPADRRELHTACEAEIHRAIAENRPFDDDIVYERRENALLDAAATSPDPIVTTVYGAAHDWENNIRGGERRVSLVEIVPASVARELRRPQRGAGARGMRRRRI